jgi:hypothetical protein
MIFLPDDVVYEIDRAQRQAEAVAICLEQHRDHAVSARMLRHKIQAIHTYIQYLEAHNDQEKASED